MKVKENRGKANKKDTPHTRVSPISHRPLPPPARLPGAYRGEASALEGPAPPSAGPHSCTISTDTAPGCPPEGRAEGQEEREVNRRVELAKRSHLRTVRPAAFPSYLVEKRHISRLHDRGLA